MSEPGDRRDPETDTGAKDLHAHDDLIGFTSASSLRGAARSGASGETDHTPPAPLNRIAVLRAEAPIEGAPPIEPSPRHARAEGRSRRAPDADRPLYPFAIYALILSAVPTMGVAAAVALFAIVTRPAPTDPVGASHAVFQARTLWAAAIGAVAGVVLIAVNLGVPVLFMVAVWVLIRGGWGLSLLSRDRAVARPNQWLIAAR